MPTHTIVTGEAASPAGASAVVAAAILLQSVLLEQNLGIYPTCYSTVAHKTFNRIFVETSS